MIHIAFQFTFSAYDEGIILLSLHEIFVTARKHFHYED